MNHNQQGSLSQPEVQKILKRPQTSKSKPIREQSLEEQPVTDTTTSTPQPIVTIPPQYSSAGEFNEIRSELVDAQGKQQNGFLRLNDIFNLNLPAELIVLSACETGKGELVRGEGIVGLTRGFMYAGAPRVVTSLWRVDDAGTAQLMSQFYQQMLAEGKRPAEALRATQLQMWNSGELKNPYYWAAFTLQGEWK